MHTVLYILLYTYCSYSLYPAGPSFDVRSLLDCHLDSRAIGSVLVSSGFVTCTIGCVFTSAAGFFVTTSGCIGSETGCVSVPAVVSVASLLVVSVADCVVTVVDCVAIGSVTGLAGFFGTTTGGFFTAALINDRLELPVVVVVYFASDGLKR